MNRLKSQASRIINLSFFLIVFSVPSLLNAKEFLVTASRPNDIYVVDIEARKVVNKVSIPKSSPGNSPGAMVLSPDGNISYIIHNRWETVSGINLNTGEEVFRAELSVPGQMRGKAPFAIDVSPDGTELAVYVNPVVFLPGEYRVEDSYVAIYDTSSGTLAKPIRKFKAPRRGMALEYSGKGDKIYVHSWDIVILDAVSGEIIGKHLWANRKREGFGEPDTLAVWPQFKQTNIFVSPYYIEDDKGVLKAGVVSLDLNTDEIRYAEFENDTRTIYFSSVVNPVKKEEVFSVYTQLTKVNIETGELIKQVDLDHTYYTVNISKDGSEVYVGGTMGDIGVYDAETLERKATILIPTGNDQAHSSLRIFSR